jgi:type IV pilus assembly protein PilC
MKKTNKINIENLTLSGTEKLNLISNLSTMINAGIPILSAIHSLAEESRGNTQKILQQVQIDITHGKQLNESLAKFPRVFNQMTIKIIRASEQAGKLDIILADLKEEIKKDIALNRKLKSAMTYPIIVFFVFIAVLTMILVVVMPKIATVFSQLKVTMPLPTKILIGSSYILLHYTWYVLGGLAALTTLLVMLYKKQKHRLLPLLYNLPVVSQLIRDIDLLRFTKNLHLMLVSGITITNALELSKDIVIKKDIAKAIETAKENVLRGKDLSYTFKQERKIFPGTMIELTQAGEKTGTLDVSLKSISEYLEYKVSDSLALLTALMEPILLVFVAVVVGAMMVAIIGPIYSIIGQIGQVTH